MTSLSLLMKYLRPHKIFSAALGLLLGIFIASIFLISHSQVAFACGDTNDYPSSCTNPLINITGSTAGHSFQSQSGALNVVDNYVNGGSFSLWCKDGVSHIVALNLSSSGCTQSNSASITPYEAQRNEGSLGSTAYYEAIIPTYNAATGSVNVSIQAACKTLNDGTGWEDHTAAPIASFSNMQIVVGGTTFSCTNNNDGNGNIVFNIAPYLTADTTTYGPDYEHALIEVENTSPLDSEKSFAVHVDGDGNYIGPADARENPDQSVYVNIQDPRADYKYEDALDGYCPTPGFGNSGFPTDSNACPPYGVLNNEGNNPPTTYTFTFQPDCSYTPSDNIGLSWRDEAGTNGNQVDPEYWTLNEYHDGQFISQVMTQKRNPNINSDNGTGKIDWVVGDTYTWTWTNVDRAHGLSVQLPFSEFTSSPGFNHADCPQPPPPSGNYGLCTTETTTNGGTYTDGSGYYSKYTRSNTTISDSSYNVLVNDTIDNNNTGTTSSKTYNYWPRGQNISITVDHQYRKNKVWYNEAGSPSTTNVPCFSASCQITNIAATGAPGNIIVAGQPVIVTASITNNSNYGLPLANQNGNNGLALYSGDDYGHNGYNIDAPPGYVNYNANPGFENAEPTWIPAGQSELISFQLPIPNDVASINVASFAHASFSDFALGAPCSINMNVYEKFELTANAYQPNGNSEDPGTSIPYEAGVSTSLPNYPVNAGTNSNFTLNGTPLFPPHVENNNYVTTPNNAHNPPDQTTLIGAWPVSQATLSGGDKYCTNIAINGGAWNVGYRGPGGPGNVADTSADGNDSAQQCLTITNEPYFKVYGSSIFAGGNYSGSSGFIFGGALKGWNSDSSPGDQGVGAGSQFLSLLVSGAISGVASGQNSASFVANPNLAYSGVGLSFANNFSNPNDASHAGDINTGVGNPHMGGDYSGTMLYPAEQSLIGPTQTLRGQTGGNYTASINGVGGLDTGAEKSYVYGTPTNQVNLTLTPGQIQNGDNVSLYVNGNIQITPVPGGATSITYPGDNTWNVTSDTTGGIVSNIPSFSLVATGNVYIDPGITELDGLYEAGIDNSSGELSTCADDFTQVTNDIFDTCEKQLIIYGNFVANHINLLRTYGSLRNSTANEDPNNGPSSLTCTNGVVNGVTNKNVGGQKTCAAEVFNSDPELNLSNPALEPPNGGAIQWSSFTSLPPVL
jgi:hypothetical protein